MKKAYLIIVIMLLMMALLVCSCKSKQQAPYIGYSPSTTTQTWTGANQVINSASWELLPSNGVYVQAGKTLNLSWSADGSLNCYFVTANQYNNFKNSNGVSITYVGKGVSNQGSISYTVQNSDTYYAILYNDALGILGAGPSVHLYQATLIER